MKRFVLVVAGIASVAALATAYATTGDGPVSTEGDPVAVSSAAADARAVEKLGISAAQLLGVTNGRAFYRLTSAEGMCYGVGPANASRYQYGRISCPSDFPIERRVVDFTDVANGPDGPYIVRSEGIAVDGVDTVRYANRRGDVVADVPVVRNVFSFRPGAAAVSIIALDRGGENAFHFSLARMGKLEDAQAP